ncbi:MAG: glycosyltransferase family 2 protein [Bdellovibrionaceae bacterium]|nr:glycosyltransferase family 2 protein [Pseudobdellovibrionaceae bacterium]
MGRILKRGIRLVRLFPVALLRKGGPLGLAKHLINKFRDNGLRGIFNAASALDTQVVLVDSYARWIKEFDVISESQRDSYKLACNEMVNPPLISIVLPTYNSNQSWLKLAIESVRNQIYPHWELCIADDASTAAGVKKILSSYAGDKRIKIHYRDKNGHISQASNSALSLATGEWLALLDHDDMISENALLIVAQYIRKNPGAQMIYSDEDKIDTNGLRHGPYFKSEWNRDLFYSHNMFSHLGCYKLDLVKKVGGFRQGFEGAQDYDLALRCIEQISEDQIIHIPKILYHWRVHAKSTASYANAKPYAELAGEKALNEHFMRRSVDAQVKAVSYGYRVQYALPENLPLVSIIIPTRNAVDLIRQCIDSIVAKTKYTHFEIIVVDNGSDDPTTIDYLKHLENSTRFKVISCPGDFNYSLLNNLAVAQCRGEYIALINNDIEIISENWLGEMVSIARQIGVGAVGAKLLYPDKSLQHGGVILGLGGVAGHSHKHLGYGQPSYFSRANLIQTFSAVTGACLVVSKINYIAVGGLDEKNLKVAFNDVDFCLRLRELGLRNVWTPYAELFHHESATRGSDEIDPAKQARFAAESSYMYQRWGKLLTSDPAYNPNLTLEKEDFSLAFPPRVEDLSGNS